MIEDLRAFVESETPSTEKKFLGDFAGFLADYATEAGGEVEVLPDTVSGDHVRALWDAENEEAPLLLLGHYDTVWSAGTLGTMPIETKDGIATGPGVFDMKCSLVQSFWDVKTARELAANLGFDLSEKLAGGASDGCLCVAVGAPVLYGLGAVGAGAHAAHEHVELESVPLRTALVARVLETL